MLRTGKSLSGVLIVSDVPRAETELDKLSCAGCGFDLKKPYAIPFSCADDKTYCASCFINKAPITLTGLKNG